MKFKIGDRVKFHGHKHPTKPGRFVSVHEEGPDTFEAIIANNLFGICWGLKWDDGSPLGLPFSSRQLMKVKV